MPTPLSVLSPLLTDEEALVMAALVESWNTFVKLPQEHPDDQNEYRAGIHRLQAMVLMRPVRRDMNQRAGQ